MRRTAVVFALVACVAGNVSADVRTEEKTQVKFEGGLGRMMAVFGGKAAREGIVSTVAVKGDRKMSTTDRTAQLVDLAEEKIYELDLSKKTYTVMTFAEMRRQMEEARRKAAEQAAAAKDDAKKSPDAANAPQYQVDFDLKSTGQSKTINGFDAKEIVMTIAIHEQGKPLEQNGGMVMTSHTWLAPNVPGVKELADFDRRFLEKIGLPTIIDAQQLAAAMGMYPMLAEGMKRMQAENVRLEGTPVLTTTSVEVAAPPGSTEEKQAAKPEPPPPTPTSISGLGGLLARKAIKSKEKEPEPAAAVTPGRASLMSMEHEMLKATPSVTDADVAIPAGFKQKS
jgi:hypothetical protein